MAVRQWYTGVGIYSDISMTSAVRIRSYSQRRILSVDIVEEAPCIAVARRVSECTVRLTNDHATNSYGWTGPTMSAVAVEDPAELVGKYLQVWFATGQRRAFYSYMIDSVEATDDGATVHGLGLDSLLDLSFAETGAQGAVGPNVAARDWIDDTLAAAGFLTRRISSTISTAIPLNFDFDQESSVGDALRGVATMFDCAVGLAGEGNEAVVAPLTASDYGSSYYLGAYSWPEPVQTERYGTLVVRDPYDDTEQEVTLDASQTGRLEVSVPISSARSDWTSVATWVGYRHASQWYAVDTPGDPLRLQMNVSDSIAVYVPAWPVATWDSSGTARYRRMLVQRIELRYDGGLSQRLSGPLYDTI